MDVILSLFLVFKGNEVSGKWRKETKNYNTTSISYIRISKSVMETELQIKRVPCIVPNNTTFQIK